MGNSYYLLLKKYVQNSPKSLEINWFDLPPNLILLENSHLITVKKLMKIHGKNKILNRQIKGLKTSTKKDALRINFPIHLDKICYIRLYALMISEGSVRTEFSLNVPEKEFHQIFEKDLKELLSKEITIKKDFNHGLERSRAPATIRFLVPIYNTIPKVIFQNKEFAKEYLRVAFEAEGSPIFNLKKHKKYIKLSRNSDVSQFFSNENDLPLEKRIFINGIKKIYPMQYYNIIKKPDSLILGEHLLLKYWFNIDSTLKLESIRLNKLGNRKGKISAKWVLYIYSGEDIERFNQQIGFMSKFKMEKSQEMLEKIPSRRKQYSALKIMREIQKENTFLVRDFNKRMKNLGYKSPQKFLWDYWNNKKIIKRVKRGEYQVIQ